MVQEGGPGYNLHVKDGEGLGLRAVSVLGLPGAWRVRYGRCVEGTAGADL